MGINRKDIDKLFTGRTVISVFTWMIHYLQRHELFNASLSGRNAKRYRDGDVKLR